MGGTITVVAALATGVLLIFFFIRVLRSDPRGVPPRGGAQEGENRPSRHDGPTATKNPSSPTPRGSPGLSLVPVMALCVLAIIVGVVLFAKPKGSVDDVRCDGHSMTPSDTCVIYSSGSVVRKSYYQLVSDNRHNQSIESVIAFSCVGGGALFLLVTALVSLERRQASAPAAPAAPDRACSSPGVSRPPVHQPSTPPEAPVSLAKQRLLTYYIELLVEYERRYDGLIGDAEEPTREIGRCLDLAGGMTLMRLAHQQFAATTMARPYLARELDVVWNGVGDWRG